MFLVKSLIIFNSNISVKWQIVKKNKDRIYRISKKANIKIKNFWIKLELKKSKFDKIII